MNIKVKQQLNESVINEDVMSVANSLYESFSNSRSIADFLNENGNTPDNILVYNFIALNESVRDESMRFTFDNGIYIPAISPKNTGRLSLTSISESSINADEFAQKVSTMICEELLMFTPTANDISRLIDAYNASK